MSNRTTQCPRARFLIISTTLTLIALFAASANAALPPLALTESGVVLGQSANGVNTYLGIPYATPPVGNLRWRPPVRYGFFPGLILHANSFGSECTQAGGGSENCLFLNIYQPTPSFAHPFTGLLPVMVWIHGGALVSGGADIYDATRLAQQGVIVVTINYRLGYLGFLAQSALDAEKHEAGNYGFMDQQFALGWVQRNILGFGGDPGKVTIFGESAGGQSVIAHLVSPTAAHLFRGAIAESGSYVEFQDYFNFIVSLSAGETTGTAGVPAGAAIADAVGCTSQTAACLRAVPASAFPPIQASTIYPFVDGILLPQTPTAAFAAGAFHHVPVIFGTNHDEWRLFVAEEYDLSPLGPLTDPEYAAAVAALEGPSNTGLIDVLVNVIYPLADFPPPAATVMSAPLALGALGTDSIFTCPARNAELELAARVPTWVYEFHDPNPPSFLPPVSFPLEDAHGFELDYLFNLSGFNSLLFLTPNQIELSDTMIGYWTHFAKTLNPNFSGAPSWSKYASGGSIESLVSPAPVTESDAAFDADHKCTLLWNTF
ncbi:MAG TPA: carboxylesterase family protein [Candidatus Binataceae bacterium]|nr:carboxylesterase family protein [Candidatus Binataceae bacterium]